MKKRKTRHITLVSYYYEKRFTLRVPVESAERLSIDERDRIKLIDFDVERWYQGYTPHLLSKNQCRKIYYFFKDEHDYFNEVIVED